MSFMEREITDKQAWYVVDGDYGIDYVPCDVVQPKSLQWEDVADALEDFTRNTTITSIELMSGYGARLSAPGYMDCTDWAVFATEQEAGDYLDENYPDDEEEDN